MFGAGVGIEGLVVVVGGCVGVGAEVGFGERAKANGGRCEETYSREWILI